MSSFVVPHEAELVAALQLLFEGVEEKVLISAQGPRRIKLHL